jgi:hypothetical protein
MLPVRACKQKATGAAAVLTEAVYNDGATATATQLLQLRKCSATYLPNAVPNTVKACMCSGSNTAVTLAVTVTVNCNS